MLYVHVCGICLTKTECTNNLFPSVDSHRISACKTHATRWRSQHLYNIQFTMIRKKPFLILISYIISILIVLPIFFCCWDLNQDFPTFLNSFWLYKPSGWAFSSSLFMRGPFLIYDIHFNIHVSSSNKWVCPVSGRNSTHQDKTKDFHPRI